jgi:hypothetical protein
MVSFGRSLLLSRLLRLLSLLGLLLVIFFSTDVLAAPNYYSSTNYNVLAPVIFPGGYSTSSSFKLNSVISQMSIGTSTDSIFKLFAGFLYFPFVSTPAVSVTAGDAQVTLTWTAADASTGWSVGGYAVGQSTVSGGPYTYTDVGNVLSSVRSGLANGTQYYFVIRVADALGYYIATSTEVSATPSGGVTPPPPPPPGGGGGGGGGGGEEETQTGVIFSGRAYPLSRVSIVKDGQLAVTTIAGPDSNFKATLSGLASGNYTFSVYGEDWNNVRSSPFTFPIYISSGVMTEISGIFIAPTISVDKTEVKKGENIAIFGQSAQTAEVAININSEPEYFLRTLADENGIYLLNFDTSPLSLGGHSAKSKAIFEEEISYFSHTVGFRVGLKDVVLVPGQCTGKADLNADCRVNLVDFSIAAYWYKRLLSQSFETVEKERLNGDAKIDLVDFSIMAYYWTG